MGAVALKAIPLHPVDAAVIPLSRLLPLTVINNDWLYLAGPTATLLTTGPMGGLLPASPPPPQATSIPSDAITMSAPTGDRCADRGEDNRHALLDILIRSLWRWT